MRQLWITTTQALLQWTPLAHFWQWGESAIHSQKKTATLTHHSPSFRTCCCLTRDRSLSLSPSLYSSSSVSHAEIKTDYLRENQRNGKDHSAPADTHIYTICTHVLLPSNAWTGHVFLREARETEDGVVRRWTGVLMNMCGLTRTCGKPFLTFCKDKLPNKCVI